MDPDENLDWEMPYDEEQEFFKKLPLISPKQTFHLLEKRGYRGQIPGRKSLALAAYRHVRRIKQIHLEKVPRELLPPKNNILLLGPTGCGKTFLAELLFKHILKLPTVIIDITGFSETGYIGEDTRTILTRLLLAANSNPLIASVGVICLDEFDKLASNHNSLRSDGQGTTKDVSGFGVQRELLKMLESSHIDVPSDFDNSIYSSKQGIYTGDITFIACGAFSGIKLAMASWNRVPQIGFRHADTDPLSSGEGIAYCLTDEEANDITNLHRYGFMPELIARFTRVVPMFPLDRETLKSILIDNVVKKFQIEFRTEGLELEIEEAVLDHIVEQSYERQTGARGLGSMLTSNLEEAAFEYFCGSRGKVILKEEGGQAVTSWEKICRNRSKSSGGSV